MLKTTFFRDLPSVRDILADPQTVFVIPTFQRPYAWEEKQIRDLRQDLDHAAVMSVPQHYFAQAHVVAVTNVNSDLSPLLDAEHAALAKALQHYQIGNIRQLYAVVDGQQRLVTLYLLSILQELLVPSPVLPAPYPNLFQLMLPNGAYLPRIILGTAADHNFFAAMINWLLGQKPGSVTAPAIVAYINGLITTPNSPAQERLKEAGVLLLKEFFLSQAVSSIPLVIPLVANPMVRMGLTELDTHYALTSFITLNDRGKPLSHLERLKAFWLERAVMAGQNPHLIVDIHHVFGDLYRTADRCVHAKLAGTLDQAEDLLCQLLYHWLDMQNPHHQLWYGAGKVYGWFVEQPAPHNIPAWMHAAKELRNQLDHLCTAYLDPASPSAHAPSIHYPATSTLHEDYFAVLFRLGLPSHLLALLLKFRQQFANLEWHDRHPFQVAVNPQLIQPICDLLNATTQNSSLDNYRQRIDAHLPHRCGNVENVECMVTVSKSILEAVERIAMLAWKEGSNPRVGFANSCAMTFVTTSHVATEINRWYVFCNSGASYDQYYIDKLCHRNAPSSERHLLWEWERWLIEQVKGTTIPRHPGQPPVLELEHVLPDAWQDTITQSGQTFNQWGFKDDAHFQRNLLQRIGNKALLWKLCNESVGNNHPEIKAYQ